MRSCLHIEKVRLQLRIEIHHARIAVFEVFDSALGDLSADEKLAVSKINILPAYAEGFVAACAAIGEHPYVIHKFLRVFSDGNIATLFILLRFKRSLAKFVQISRREQ